MIYKIVIQLLILLGVLLSCQQKRSSEQETNTLSSKGDTVTVIGESVYTRLRFEEVKAESFRRELITSGTIRAIPNYYAEIAPPFPGRVLKSYVRLGQRVEPGSPIFEISSPDYFNAQKEYFDAKQEFKQAELNLKRQQDLLKNGVGVQRELEAAETDFITKNSALQNAAAALKIFNVNPEKISLGDPLVVNSPIRGEIVGNNIVIGQYLREDAPPIAIVAELSKVWVVGQVKEKDLRFISELDSVEIKVAAFPEKVILGKVYHVNEIVDEETRSVQVLIECDNKERILKPGMYVTVRFVGNAEPTILIPSKAVLQKNENQFVFTKLSENQFLRKNIETSGTSSSGKILVKSGLKVGETIVSEGGIYLLVK
ncbi:MAG: efflux RND transporter periplasmic adaptor subunit [Cytophagales bacterium]|nr:efflux RND transporter periplasmic adaptor subunit [Cytophagales bacterium]MDW8385224.1 efflux RND transporter periplasmic adaptor subunit [Flammeovirgaceae bacterium]